MPRPKPPHHWERQVERYARKIVAAATPTQRAYAIRMKQAAERNLALSRRGVERIDAGPEVIDLDRDEYREL